MNTFGRIFGSLLIAGMALSVPSRSGADSLGAMRVGLVEGDVQVKIADTGEWAPVSVNMPLVEGDELWVPPDGRAALQTSDGARVRLDGGTALEVLRMDRDSFQLHLAQGHAYVLSLAPRRSLLQLDAPDASVRAFGSATFRVDVLDGETDVSVFKGSVLAESESGTTPVRAGAMLALGPGGYAELSPLSPPDEWEHWNRARDRIVLARGRSRRYLPAELRVYAGDFDRSGRWVYVRGYGYCWTPTVVVIGNWAPYRHGRWVWRGGHYVWIGYEPWGWAPYHYGRWTFVRKVGWCWVPPDRGEVFWGPGYVAWVQTPEHVAWVPLAPREIYYGYGSYGRYSVDITNVNVNTIRVTHVYRNVNVADAITLVRHTTFVTGQPAPVERRVATNIRENFMQRRNLVPGRPRIKPVESSYVPVVRPVPEAKRPPLVVRAIDAKKLRQARPLVREPDRSALRPEGRIRPLEARKVEKPRPARERVRERGLERGRPPESPAPGKGPEAPAARERRIERERQPEPAGETRKPREPQGAREGTGEKGRPSILPPGDRERPERSREEAPDRGPERGGKDGAGVRPAPAPEKERPGPARVSPERDVRQEGKPAPGLRKAPPGETGGAEAPRKKSGRADRPRRAEPEKKGDGKPEADESEGGNGNGKPERPSGREERRDTR